MGLSIPTYPLSKKYTEETTEGMGAIKGAPCEIASIELTTQGGRLGYSITFEWEDNQQVRHQAERFFPFGQKGDKGDKGNDGQSPVITVKSSTSTEYLLEIDSNGTVITTPNLKGAKGADGEKGEKGADGRTFTIKADYPDMASLISAHPTGQAGDAYFVGNSDAPNLVVWEEDDNEWYDAGQIKGLKGDKGDKGDDGTDGITPQVTVNTQTETEYTLKIKTGEQELITPNLRGKDGDGTVDEEMSTTSENALMNKTTTVALNGKVDKEQGKGLSTNDYTTADKEKLAGINLNNYIPTSQKGANSGVAELDVNGKVPSSQLPSYVDDVIEGYYNSNDDRFYEESTYITEITPEVGKSWVDISTNKTYRWTGSVYVRVDEGVQLGETSDTAYRGDRGKVAYDDSQANKTHIGDLSQLQTTAKTDLVSAINEAAQTITIDSALSATSENPVQNKVIKGALDEKVDAEQGKGLSTNDFTNAYKTQLDNLNVDLSNKQDKTLSQSKSIEDVNVTTVEGAVNALKTHTDRAVTDASGAHGFKVTNSNNETKILYKNDNAWVEIPLGDNITPITNAQIDTWWNS